MSLTPHPFIKICYLTLCPLKEKNDTFRPFLPNATPANLSNPVTSTIGMSLTPHPFIKICYLTLCPLKEKNDTFRPFLPRTLYHLLNTRHIPA